MIEETARHAGHADILREQFEARPNCDITSLAGRRVGRADRDQ
jgi:Protein of unknown function (DUF664)